MANLVITGSSSTTFLTSGRAEGRGKLVEVVEKEGENFGKTDGTGYGKALPAGRRMLRLKP
jgi:hypothetical protein